MEMELLTFMRGWHTNAAKAPRTRRDGKGMALTTLEQVKGATDEEILEMLRESKKLRTDLLASSNALVNTRKEHQMVVRERNVLEMRSQEIARVLLTHCEAAPDELEEKGYGRYLVEWLAGSVGSSASKLAKLDQWIRENYTDAELSHDPVENAIRIMDSMQRGVAGLVSMAEGNTPPSGNRVASILEVLKAGTMPVDRQFPPPPRSPAEEG